MSDSVIMTGMEPEFHVAARRGDIGAFEGMGSEAIESTQTADKNTILHVHFFNHHDRVSEKFVRQVLAMCPSLVLKANAKLDTVLHIAARNGHHKMVQILIDHAKSLPEDIIEVGAESLPKDIIEVRAENRTAILRPYKGNKFSSRPFEILVKRRPKRAMNKNKGTANEVGVEKRLIRAVNKKKDTALHEAARYGHYKVMDVLIKEESDHLYFGKNVDRETPLYIAVVGQHWNVVDTMLNNSDSPQYSGPYRRTALHAAVCHLDEEKVPENVFNLLISHLSATKEADKNGWVPLHLAAIVGNSNMVELLLRNDSSAAYMQDENGRTALHYAALHKDSSVMKKIIEYCPDCCELVDKNGSNALHCRAMGDKYYNPTRGESYCYPPSELQQIVRDVPQISYLLNETDHHGNTPLHLLAYHAYVLDHPLLKSQYPRGYTRAYNNDGQTILDIADDEPSHLAENKSLRKLKDFGARLGGQFLRKYRGNTITKPKAMYGSDSSATTVVSITSSRIDCDSDSPATTMKGEGKEITTMTGEGKEKQSKLHENEFLIKCKDIGARLRARFLPKHHEETKTTTMKGEGKEEGTELKRLNYFAGYDQTTKIEYLVGVSNTLSVVAILIATVTFAAGFTLPGGLIQEGEHQGSPILKYNPAFMIFVITDVFSFVISTSTVLATFLSSIIPKEDKESRQVYRSLLNKCVYSTLVALGFMIVAFGAGMYSVLGVSKGLGLLILLIISSFFVLLIILLPKTYEFMESLDGTDTR